MADTKNPPPIKMADKIAFCGLICEMCHLAGKCDGCKSARNNCGKHLSDAGCFQRKCCMQKEINGCWECDEFPCDRDMYSADNDPKVKAFAHCIKEDGVEKFLGYVDRNKKMGLDIRFQGNYDFKTESEVLALLRNGPTRCQRQQKKEGK